MEFSFRDMIVHGLRLARVAPDGGRPNVEQYEFAKATACAMFAEIVEAEGFPFSWRLENDRDIVPKWAYLPLAQMLAFEIAPRYGRLYPEQSYWQGMRRLRRHAFPDDRAGPLTDEIPETEAGSNCCAKCGKAINPPPYADVETGPTPCACPGAGGGDYGYY